MRLYGYVDVYSLRTYNQVLKKECVAALRRIFKLCDTNKDNILDAAELNEFQVCRLPPMILVLLSSCITA